MTAAVHLRSRRHQRLRRRRQPSTLLAAPPANGRGNGSTFAKREGRPPRPRTPAPASPSPPAVLRRRYPGKRERETLHRRRGWGGRRTVARSAGAASAATAGAARRPCVAESTRGARGPSRQGSGACRQGRPSSLLFRRELRPDDPELRHDLGRGGSLLEVRLPGRREEGGQAFGPGFRQPRAFPTEDDSLFFVFVFEILQKRGRGGRDGGEGTGEEGDGGWGWGRVRVNTWNIIIIIILHAGQGRCIKLMKLNRVKAHIPLYLS